MKLLLLSLTLSALYACQQETAATKFEANLTAVSDDWRYAKYKFSLDKYDDVEVAVRVKVNGSNEATHLEVKDLKAGREDRKVEKAILMGTMSGAGDTYNFSGTSMLEEGGRDFGGTYSGTLTVTDGSVADDGCCGEMKFTSTGQGELTFTGVRMEVLSADDWQWEEEADTGAEPEATSATCKDYKLVFSGLKDVMRGERFDFTVKALTCDDEETSNFNGNELTMEWKYDSGETWRNSIISGKELDDPSTYTHEDYAFGIGDNSKKRYLFKASVTGADGVKAEAVSDAFDLNPILAVDDGSCSGKYSLEVSSQPADAEVEKYFTFEVTLKCDSMIVSDPTTDSAARAPITLAKYKTSSMTDWVDSSMIEDKEVAGVLTAGKKEFAASFKSAQASLQYKIGVTINGNEYTAETNPFNITE